MGNRLVVGIMTITFSVPSSNSLKDKRQVVRSVVANLRNKFNMSVAEIDDLDSWRRATIGISCVSNDKTVVNSMLDKAISYVESNPQLEIIETEMELV